MTVQKEFERKRLFGIVGDPVEHSKSPSFWNAAFRELEINAKYLRFRVSDSDLPMLIKEIQARGLIGVNVTMPHKFSVASMCHVLHPPADLLKAVNCVKFLENGRIEGYNTDATGFLRIISRLSESKIGYFNTKQAFVMGAGGAASAIIWALQKLFFNVFQIARCYIAEYNDNGFTENIPDNTRDKNIKKLAWNMRNFYHGISESDIIINATPLGREKKDFVTELKEFLSKDKIFVDLNYGYDSNLTATALTKGCKVFDGRELLFEQGLDSFRILVEVEPPEQIIRKSIFG